MLCRWRPATEQDSGSARGWPATILRSSCWPQQRTVIGAGQVSSFYARNQHRSTPAETCSTRWPGAPSSAGCHDGAAPNSSPVSATWALPSLSKATARDQPKDRYCAVVCPPGPGTVPVGPHDVGSSARAGAAVPLHVSPPHRPHTSCTHSRSINFERSG